MRKSILFALLIVSSLLLCSSVASAQTLQEQNNVDKTLLGGDAGNFGTQVASNYCTTSSDIDVSIPASIQSTLNAGGYTTVSWYILVSGQQFNYKSTNASGDSLFSVNGTGLTSVFHLNIANLTSVDVGYLLTLPDNGTITIAASAAKVGETTTKIVSSDFTLHQAPSTEKIFSTNAVTICPRTEVSSITLKRSEKNMTYTLYKNGTQIATQDGTGTGNLVFSADDITEKLDAGTYTVKVKNNTTGNVCDPIIIDDEEVISFYHDDVISIDPAGEKTSCANEIKTYAASRTDGKSYTWRIVGGTLVSGQGTSSINVKWVNDTQTPIVKDSIILGYTTQYYCTPSDSAREKVTVNPIPHANAVSTAGMEVCENSTTTFTTNTVTAHATSFVWDVSGGTSSSYTITPLSVNWGDSGIGSVKITYTNNYSCSDDTTITNIAIKPRPTPTLKILSGEVDVACQNQEYTYYTESGMSDYVWKVTNGTITAYNGASLAESDQVTIKWETIGTTDGTGSISINYTALNSCSALTATSQSVVLHPQHSQPVITAEDVEFCVGKTIKFSTASGYSNYQWGTDTKGIVSTNTTNTQTISWTGTQAGKDSVYVSYVDENGCSSNLRGAILVTVDPLPTPSISSGDFTVCQSENATSTYTAAAASNVYYYWEVKGGTISGSNTSSSVKVIWTGTSGAIRLAETNKTTGCSDTTELKTVTINIRPTINLSGITSICAGTTGVVYTTDAGKTSYTWTVTGGSKTAGGSSTDNTVTVSWPIQGSGKVAVNYTNAAGCTIEEDSVLAVTINPLPTAQSITGTSALCVGDSKTYSIPNTYASYQWITDAKGNVGTTSSVDLSWATAGSDVVYVLYKDANGCSPAAGKSKYTVTINPNPEPVIKAASGSFNVCASTSTADTYTDTQTGSAYTYQWAVVGGTINGSSTGSSVKVIWDGAATGAQISVTQKNTLTGCYTTATQQISIKKRPEITITTGTLSADGTKVCAYTTGSTYTTAAGMSKYLWTVTGGTIEANNGTSYQSDDANSIKVDWGAATTGVVIVNYTNSDGCSMENPKTASITINPLPTPNIEGGTSICANSELTLSANVTGLSAGNYTWTVPAGTTISSGALNEESVGLKWSTNGDKTITFNYVDANGCTAQKADTLIVNVNPQPTPSFNGNKKVCVGETLDISTDAGKSDYEWTLPPDATLLSGGTSTTNKVSLSWSTTGIKTIGINYKDNNKCGATTPASYDIEVVAKETPTIKIPSNICLDRTATFVTNAGMSDYSWTVSGGTIIGGSDKDTVIVKWSSAGSHAVTISYENTGFCTLINTKTITVLTPPKTYSVSVDNSNYCKSDGKGKIVLSGMENGIDYTITNTSDKTTTTINSTSSSSSSVTLAELTAGKYIVSATLSSIGQCPITLNPTAVEIKQAQIPPTDTKLKISNELICTGSSAIITVENPQAGFEYLLVLNSDTVSNSVIKGENNPSWTVTTSGDYQVYVYDAGYIPCGIYSSASVHLDVKTPPTAQTVKVSAPSYCKGGDGVYVNVAATQSYVIYSLVNASGTVIESITSTSTSPITFTTKVTAGTYKVIGKYSKGDCEANMANSVTVTETPLPTSYSISPTSTTTNCAGASGSGNEIKLVDSDSGVNYTLYLDGATTGVTKAGTGGEISFGSYKLGGTYTVKAVDATSSCESSMSGSFTIQITQMETKYTLSPTDGRYCEDGSGVDIKLSGSTSGSTYVLYRGSTSLKTLSGTGNALDFGNYTVDGVYFVTASQSSNCPESMSGTVTVKKVLKPTIMTLAANSTTYCDGDAGVSLYLSSQENGVTYQLVKDGSNVGTAVVGDNSGLGFTFSGAFTKGIYSVVESVSGITCTSFSNNISVSTVTKPKTDLTLSGTTLVVCKGSTATFVVNNTETDVTYSLYNGTIYANQSYTGNGGQIKFSVSAPGTYYVHAVRGTTGCSTVLTASINVTDASQPNQVDYSWVPGTDCTNGTVITIDNTQPGVTYTLYNRAISAPVSGYTLTGNGALESFPAIVDVNGTYYIVASIGDSCAKEMTQSGDIAVQIPNTVQRYKLTNTSSCVSSGATMNGSITLENSEANTQYSLYRENGTTDILISTIQGTGSSVVFDGLTTAGEYYILGTLNACTNEMSNRITLTAKLNPKSLTLSGVTSYCGDDKATVVVDDAEANVSYSLYLGTKLLNTIVSSGSDITFAGISTAGTYLVKATSADGCSSDMSNMITISSKETPNTYNVWIDNTPYCSSSDQANLYIDHMQEGVTYSVTNIGTGVTIDYPAYKNITSSTILANLTEGYYTVSASWSGACKTAPSSNVTVESKQSVSPANDFDITIDNTSICSGSGTTATIKVTSPVTGLVYELVKNGVRTGNSRNTRTDEVSWTISESGDYQVYVYAEGYTSCGVTSQKSVSLDVKEKPKSETITPSDYFYCNGTDGVYINVDVAQIGMTYTLYRKNDGKNDTEESDDIEIEKYVSSEDIPFSFTTKVTAGFYYVKANYTSGSCSTNMANTIEIQEYPIPTIYTVTPATIDCHSGAKLEVKLSGSDDGVTYTLYVNGVSTGYSIEGNGNELDFGKQSIIGVYTVMATDELGCSIQMNGSSTVTSSGTTPTAYNVFYSANMFCEGTKGIEVTTDGATSGVSYILSIDGTAQDTIVGTSAAGLDFGYYALGGVYSVLAVQSDGCQTPMNSVQTIKMVEAPDLYTLYAGDNGLYCTGGMGVKLYLNGQQDGVTYQLLRNNITYGSPVVGITNSAPLTFPGYYTEGIYTVSQNISGLVCNSSTTNTVTIKEKENPIDLGLDETSATVCKGATTEFHINGSESGVTYKLYYNGAYTSQSYDGDGGQLTFTVSAAGSYSIVAVRSNVGCTTTFAQTFVVTESPNPEIRSYTATDGIDCSNGSVISVIDTQAGVTYTLVNAANDVAAYGYTLVGNGTTMSFPPMVDSGASYYILAENSGCSKSFLTYGPVVVDLKNAIAKKELQLSSSTCVGMGETMAASITMVGSETGVTYSLYLDGQTDPIQSLVGSGANLIFSGISKEGTYHVIGVTSSCTNEMLNRVTVTKQVKPATYTIEGKNALCNNADASITVDNSENGITYQLVKDGTTIRQLVSSGGPFDFSVSESGTYTVVAELDGCSTTMKGSVVVNTSPEPTAYGVSVDNSSLCSSDETANLIIKGEQEGITYTITEINTGVTQTIKATETRVVSTVLAALSVGYYDVVASWDGSCPKILASGLSVQPAPTPSTNASLSISEPLICSDSSATIAITNYESGMVYDLMLNGTKLGQPKNSDLDVLKWTVTKEGDYQYYAYAVGYPNCGIPSTTFVSLKVKEHPTKHSFVVPADTYCEGSDGVYIGLDGAQADVVYDLYKEGNKVDSYVSSSDKPFIFANKETAGDYQVYARYSMGYCVTADDAGSTTLDVESSPNVYAMSETGTKVDCSGTDGNGYEVALVKTDYGVKYILYINEISSGDTIIGTGSRISFGKYKNIGVYTIKAISTTGCTSDMSGVLEISNASSLTKYILSPEEENFCKGTRGVDIKLSGSTSGVTYSLCRNSSTLVSTLTGSGDVLDFGYFNTSGVYTVVATGDKGCPMSMTGSVNAIEKSLPNSDSLRVANAGNYCSTNNGVSIYLDSQESGVSYQLIKVTQSSDGTLSETNIGSAVEGNATQEGLTLTFPGLYTSGVYKVKATVDGLEQCSNYSSNAVLIENSKTPNDVSVDTEDLIRCSGDTTKIYIENTETDVTYKVYCNGIYTGYSKLGNGGRLYVPVFGYVAGSYVYTVTATRISSDAEVCSLTLSKSVIVTQKTLPKLLTYEYVVGTSCDAGGTITIQNSQTGIIYQIYSSSTNEPVPGIESQIGNGGDLIFTLVGNGTYYLMASNGNCSSKLTSNITVNITNAPTRYMITKPDAVCSSNDTGTTSLTLIKSQIGVTYELYKINGTTSTSTGKSLSGTGGSLIFTNVSAGIYSILGKNSSCSSWMLDTVEVVVGKSPTALAVHGGTYCETATGASIEVYTKNTDGSYSYPEEGVNYALYYDDGENLVKKASIIGSGSIITFTHLVDEGTYTVIASTEIGCSVDMSNTVIVKKTTSPTVSSLKVANDNYCDGTNGSATLTLSSYEASSGVTYKVVNLLTGDTILLGANPYTIKKGYYHIIATCTDGACSTEMSVYPVEVDTIPSPSSAIDVQISSPLVCTGDSAIVSVHSPESGVIYDLTKDGVRQKLLINSSLVAQDSVLWIVKGDVGTTATYGAFAYTIGYEQCGVNSDKTVSFAVKDPPLAFDLSAASNTYCESDGGANVLLSGAQSGLVYRLYSVNTNELKQSHTAISNNSFTFDNVTAYGSYYAMATYSVGTCRSTMNDTITITIDSTSINCSPFKAENDELVLSESELSNESSSGGQVLHLSTNDIMGKVDRNMKYTLITTWVDANGRTVSTQGKVQLTNGDNFVYTKPSNNFYGRDSVLYVVVNLDYPNRIDTAVVYIIIGNQQSDGITLFIPNAFSPNGDRKNDLFIIQGIDNQLSSTLEIFNRWGAAVYKSSGDKYLNDWDGTSNEGLKIGSELPIGTYFYVFKLSYLYNQENRKAKFNGYVELRR